MHKTTQTRNYLYVEFNEIGGPVNRLISEIEYIKSKRIAISPTIICKKNSILHRYCQKNNISFFTFQGLDPSEFNKQNLSKVALFCVEIFILIFIVIYKKIDLIRCNHYMWCTYANLISYITRIKTLIHLRDHWYLPSKVAKILKMNRLAHFVAISQFTKLAHMINHELYGLDIAVIYDGIESTIFTKTSSHEIKTKEQSKAKIISMVSRIETTRDVDLFINIAAHLLKKYPNLQFHHIGFNPNDMDLKYYQKLIRLVKSLKIENKVVFQPYINNPLEMADTLKQSYLMIVPAKAFSLPNVAIEAIACGVPVVASAGSGNREVIQDGINGLLVKTHNHNAFAEAIQLFLDDKKLYVKVARSCRPSLAQNFFEAQYRKLLEKCDSILESKYLE